MFYTCCTNHDILCSGIARMHYPHTNLNVNIGVSTQVTSEKVSSQKDRK